MSLDLGFAKTGVRRSGEFQRIARLPRREETIEPWLVDAITEYLRVPGSTARLRPDQARALKESHDQLGSFNMLAVGAGKFLISVLIPTIVESERPLLIVPASLREQTQHEIKKWSKHFRIHLNLQRGPWAKDCLPPIPPDADDKEIRRRKRVAKALDHGAILSYETLSSTTFADFLDLYRPTDIILDEAHKIARRKSARTRRLRRYVKDNPVRLYPLSGTMARRSIEDYQELMVWTLKDTAPIPITFYELKEWHCALDEGVPEHARVGPGALLDFCTPEERAEGLAGVRKGFRRRLTETPGVVATRSDSLGTSLRIVEFPINPPQSVIDAFAILRDTWQTPGGEEVDSPVSLWRHSRELVCGMYYRWNPEPPTAWRLARQAWHRFLRHTIEHNRQNLDSPLQVANAILAGDLGEVPEYEAWCEVRDTYEPQVEPVWISDYLVDAAIKWANDTGGIVWTDISAVGERFAEKSGLPYFGGGSFGEGIREYKGPCIASIKAHSEGKNLVQWSRALVLTPPSGGVPWEQLLGRLHRPGQTADEIEFEVVLGSREMWRGFAQARADARYLEDAKGMSQKLNLASVFVTEPDEAAARMRGSDPLWQGKP